MAIIYFWLPASYIRRRPQHVTSAGSGGRRDTLWPGDAATAVVAVAAAAGAAAAAAGRLLYSLFGN